jgi:L,D-peptidoglycan transpeptidase YkuD (ErfK/YbiS/YcfS/YnhG family)
MKKPAVIVAVVALLFGAGMLSTQRADAADVPAYHPSRLTHVGDAQQLLVVAGESRTSTYATLRAFWKKSDGSWAQAMPSMAARNGYGGWVKAADRVQDTGTTPSGTFPLAKAYGAQVDPGTRLPYRRFDSNDYWSGDQQDPKTYNLFQSSASANRTWRTGEAERLAAYPTQYEYFVSVEFNTPAASTIRYDSARSQYYTTRPVNTKLGNAIFLHVNGKGSTGGCVSLRRSDLISVLRWLDPAKKPRIVMAPLSDLGTA